jgi:hypothetical protein
MWGLMINRTRDMARQAFTWAETPEEREAFKRWITVLPKVRNTSKQSFTEAFQGMQLRSLGAAPRFAALKSPFPASSSSQRLLNPL